MYSWFTMLCSFLLFNKVNQLYIYPFFLGFFPILVITEHWVEFPVLYSRFLVVIYCIDSSMYMSVSISPFFPLPSSPISLVFYICDNMSTVISLNIKNQITFIEQILKLHKYYFLLLLNWVLIKPWNHASLVISQS